MDLGLAGKRALVLGVANKRSIAWAIAQALAAEGMQLALTYQERMEDSVRELARGLTDPVLLPCDVQRDDEVTTVFKTLEEQWGSLDVLVHSLAFAPRDALEGDFLDTSRQAFQVALDISAYSLVHVAREAAPLMEKAGGGSIITMTYLGSERAMPGYNVMGVAKAALEASVRYLAADLGPAGVRVNAISAGPVRTLAAAGIAGFKRLYGTFAEVAPLRSNITIEDVGGTAVYLASDLSRQVTGEVLHVDGGFNVLGVPTAEG